MGYLFFVGLTFRYNVFVHQSALVNESVRNVLEQFSNECRKTKTKVITLTKLSQQVQNTNK